MVTDNGSIYIATTVSEGQEILVKLGLLESELLLACSLIHLLCHQWEEYLSLFLTMDVFA